MHSSYLQPPNSQCVNDTVIRTVVQRSTPLSRGEVCLQYNQPSNQRQTYEHSLSPTDTVTPEMTRDHATQTRTAMLAKPPRWRSHSTIYPCCATRDTQRENITSTNTESPFATRERERERHRLNQERYRARQKKRITDLEDDVRRLANEIENLKFELHGVPIGVTSKQTVWNVATEYFRLFQYGLSAGALHGYALSFLQKTMSPDVTDGLEYGPESLLENWRLISLLFDGIDVRLHQLVEVGKKSVVATTTTSITISKNTVLRVFPHLDSDGTGGADVVRWSPLSVKLRSRAITLHGSVRFDWDNKCERVIGIYSQSDLLTPLLSLLGDLDGVARVLDGALVTSEFRISMKARF
ncbi:hypothetical protein PPTG_06074 [Phytophthora nicotianae INRA-310]|uniref:BZIP domain-containing protein n=1 Tax=Phytophthora nicotianae (strain INRA-310) TaxID=761204 RepID=W2QV58_PHYN3|nr:hypothetical protein PPTG_06074 [Phytophthora nicotianae INRA-310]ETN17013.1 hypothetical protein PPTG_06074 [Phytophthora nicotianae INRA-310]